MKKVACMCLVLALFLTVMPNAYAAETETNVKRQEYTLENGITVIEEITETSMQRASVKQGTKNVTLTRAGVTIAEISFFATFRYDGTTSEVLTKMMLKTDTYEGWTYHQQSFTSSGATVTLRFYLSHALTTSSSYTATLSCDKDGNLY